MATTSTGDLRNSLASPEKVAYRRKQFSNKIYATSKQYTVNFYDTTGSFVLGQYLLGTGILGNRSARYGAAKYGQELYTTPGDDFPTTTRIFNDNNILKEMFFRQDDFADDTDWVFDYTNFQIITTTNDLVSNTFAQDDTQTFSYAENTIENEPTGFTSQYSLKLVTDSGDVAIDWNGSTTFTGTNSLGFKISNSGSGETLDMTNVKGVPIILTIAYEN
jgi:hypothetical protein